jgi:hypothetical protein
MAQISPYEIGEVASHAVGTPGVDTSGAQLAQAVSNDAGQVFQAKEQVNAAINSENKRLLDKAQDAQIAYQNKLEDAVRTTGIANRSASEIAGLADAHATLQKQNEATPEKTGPAFNDALTQRIQEIGADNTLSPLMRQGVLTKVTEAGGEMQKQIATNLLIQQALNARGQFQDTANKLVQQASNPNLTLQDVGNIRSSAQALSFGLNQIYPPDQAPKQQKELDSGIVKGWLNSKIAGGSPQQVLDILKSGAMKDTLDGKDQEQLAHDAQNQIHIQIQDAAYQSNVATVQNRITASNTYAGMNPQDMGSVTQTLASLKAQGAQMQALLKQHPGDVNLVGQIEHNDALVKSTTKVQQNFGTAEAARKIQEQAQFYKTPQSIEAQKNLNEAQSALQVKIAQGNMSKEDGLKEAKKLQDLNEKAFNAAGVHNVPQEQYLRVAKFTSKMLDHFANEPDPLWLQGVHWLQQFTGQAQKAPAAQGQSHAATVNHGISSYDKTMTGLKNQYLKTYGKPPDAGALKIMDGHARQKSVQDVYGQP